MRDFSHRAYAALLGALRQSGYACRRFSDNAFTGLHALLRHDVDRLPGRALALARIEAKSEVSATYFFRSHRCSLDPDVVKTIAGLGHEIGYHYENLSDHAGNSDAAWEDFRRQLDRLRRLAPIRWIAMHGRPLTRWDNRDLWTTHDYRSADVREAYLDIDWSRYRYFTDTGRSWNSAANVRDRPFGYQPSEREQAISSTFDLMAHIAATEANLIISTHPERWTASTAGWFHVLVLDGCINVAKLATSALKGRSSGKTASL